MGSVNTGKLLALAIALLLSVLFLGMIMPCYAPNRTLTMLTPSGSGTTNPASPGSYTYSQGTVVSVSATPSSGWYFDHWILDGSDAGSANPISVTMNTNHSLQAAFGNAVPEFPGADISILASTCAFLVAFLFALKRKK